MANTFYTNAGCTLVALNPFKPVPQLYSPELMREYHAASQPQVRPPRFPGNQGSPSCRRAPGSFPVLIRVFISCGVIQSLLGL